MKTIYSNNMMERFYVYGMDTDQDTKQGSSDRRIKRRGPSKGAGLDFSRLLEKEMGKTVLQG